MKTDYAHGCDHASRNLRYLGVAEEAPAVRSRRDTQWRTSIQSKQRDKYETNEISENVGGWSGLRNGGGGRANAAKHKQNYHKPPRKPDKNKTSDKKQQGPDKTDKHTRIGVFFVSYRAQG